MIDFSQFLDRYSINARLYPALLVVLPALLPLLTWFPQLYEPLRGFVALAAACGGIYLLGQLGRDRGKRLQPELYKKWGGKPSVALLRWNDDRIDRFTKQGYHTYLAAAVPEARFSTPAEELADPGLADEAYEAGTQWLLGRTRDSKAYRLLFIENIAFGFRRNVLGLKPYGIIISVAAAILSTGAAAWPYFSTGHVPSILEVLVTAIAWAAVVLWISVVLPDWVKIPAEQYARHLLAACTELAERSKRTDAAE